MPTAHTVCSLQLILDSRFGKGQMKVTAYQSKFGGKVTAYVPILSKCVTFPRRRLHDRKCKDVKIFCLKSSWAASRKKREDDLFRRLLQDKFEGAVSWSGGTKFTLTIGSRVIPFSSKRGILVTWTSNLTDLKRRLYRHKYHMSSTAKIITREQWDEFIQKQTQGKVKPVTDYLGRRRIFEHKFQCTRCGDVWNSGFNNLHKPKCLSCDGLRQHGYSESQLKWLRAIEKKTGLQIQHAGNSRSEKRITIGNKRLAVDGFCKELGIVFEYYGDSFHGNPKLYEEGDKPHPFDKKITAKEMFEKTKNRERLLRKQGFKIITIWHSDFIDPKKRKRWARQFIRRLKKWKVLQ